MPDNRLAPERRPFSILVIGGGASGVIMAAHLLRAGRENLSVTIVEKRRELGRGIAYSTAEPDHLLNVRASNLSALADEPEHFARWLAERGIAKDFSSFYAPRMVFGEYLGGLAGNRLRREEGTCVELSADDRSVTARLAGGKILRADAAVLATGHEECPAAERAFAEKLSTDDAPPDPAAPVLILGTGLSAVDVWLSLERHGHFGPVVALSRRGLLPAGHPQRIEPTRFARADLPIGEHPAAFMRWLREACRHSEAEGRGWHPAIDGLRPFNQEIWQAWTEAQRRRFLRHGKTVWHIHRHRMAPDIFRRIAAARASGRLRVLSGRLRKVERAGTGWAATVRPRQAQADEVISAGRIYDCCGVASDPARSTNPLIQALLKAGTARPDSCRIGLDVTQSCAVVNGAGRASERLFAIGPLTRGTFLEIEAVPDIRVQCAALARRLLGKPGWSSVKNTQAVDL